MKPVSPLYSALATMSLFTTVAQAQLPPPAQQPPPARTANAPEPNAAPPAVVLPSGAAAGPLPSDDVLIIVPGGEGKLPRATSRASVGGVKVTGLSEVQAALLVRRTFAPLLDKRIALWDGRTAHSLTRRDLGASIPAEELVQRAREKNGDVPVDFKLDTVRAIQVISRLTPKIEATAASNNEKVSIAQDGSLQRAVALIERGEEVRPAGAQPGVPYVSLVLTRDKLATPAAKPAAGAPQNYPYLLGSFSTRYDARIRGRTSNLRMAATNVNGTVVPAGGIFSANRAIGPRNAAAGWREAKMFVSGQVVNGVGSGICQCSTTIYNAALLAGFPIVERHQHYFRVMYAPASRDAAIAWGQKDFKFRNTSGGPILVKTSATGGRFHALIYGTRPMGVRVAVDSAITSRRSGTRSTAWRTIDDGTGAKRQTLSHDYYRPHP